MTRVHCGVGVRFEWTPFLSSIGFGGWCSLVCGGLVSGSLIWLLFRHGRFSASASASVSEVSVCILRLLTCVSEVASGSVVC